MSEFDVKPKQLKNQSNQIKSVSKSINTITSQIESVSNNLNLGTANYTNRIRNSLAKLATSNETESQKIKKLSVILSEVADLYEKTEKAIADSGEKISASMKKTMNQIRNQISSTGGTLGMDKSSLYSDDPVNLSNGNFVYEKTFYHYDTPLSMNLRLFYNSGSDETSMLSRGWNHNFNVKVLIDHNIYKIIDEDGSFRGFTLDKGTFKPVPGTFGQFALKEDGYVFIDDENTTFSFDKSGLLISKTDIAGWSINYTYENGKLLKVTCTDNIELAFSYTEEGFLKEVKDQSGRTVEFSFINAHLASIKDPNGDVISYDYDVKKRLKKIVAPNGELSVLNTYDDLGRITKQKFADEGIVTYQYNKDSVLMTRQDGGQVEYFRDEFYRNTLTVYADGQEVITYNNNNLRSSFMDKNGNLTKFDYDNRGNLTRYTDALGVEQSFEYDDHNHVQKYSMNNKEIFNIDYNEKGLASELTDANKGKRQYDYDDYGRLTKAVFEDGNEFSISYDENGCISQLSDDAHGAVDYTYDECYRVIATKDALGNETKYTYDKNDQLLSVTNSEGNTRRYIYDQRGNMTKVIDFNGGVIEMDYNAMNQMVRYCDADGNETKFAYNQMMKVVKKETDDGAVTEYEYDQNGRLTKTIYPLGGIETYAYDAVGNVIKRVLPDSSEINIEYDALNRAIKVEDPVKGVRRGEYDEYGNVITEYYEDGSTIHFTYDLLGNCLSKTDQNGYTQYFAYTKDNRIKEISDRHGTIAKIAYAPGGRIISEENISGSKITYAYDAVGNLIKIDDNINGVYELTYNSLNQVVQSNHIGVGIERYEYDEIGNIITVIDQEGNNMSYEYTKSGALKKTTDEAGFETVYQYDPCYRLTSVIQDETGKVDLEALNRFNESTLRFTSYKYDLEGHVISQTNQAGDSISYKYDALGRVISKNDEDNYLTQYSYRPDGLLNTVEFADGRSVKYQYDELKRLSAVEDWLGTTRFVRDNIGQIIETEDVRGDKTSFKWDDRGQCTKIVYPDQSHVTYTYNNAMHLKHVKTGNQHFDYHYYDNGQIKQKRYNNQSNVNYTYDDSGRLNSLSCVLNGKQVDCYEYGYDSLSRKIDMLHKTEDGSQRYGYTYNPQSCLTSVTLDGQLNQQFDYDSFGNRIKMTKGSYQETYGYNSLNELIWRQAGHDKYTYSYDHRGNLTSMFVNDERKLTLQFDASNFISKAVSEKGESHYHYNGFGNLNDITVNANGTISTEYYRYNYANPYQRLISKSKNDEWSNYYWDSQLLMMSSETEVSHFVNNEINTPIGTMTNGHYIVNDFDCFGVGPRANEIGFAGYMPDTITGFYNAQKRQYDSSTGRFISRDPIPGILFRSVTLNSYLYCMSDPINNMDPTGMLPVIIGAAIVGAAIGAGSVFVGDVVNSVKTGKWQPSSWQTYVGGAVGGAVQGVTTPLGAVASGAAGAATTTAVTNSLNMINGVKGYRKEDGYGVGKLLVDTGVSALEGSATGLLFKWTPQWLKIDHLTKGTGSDMSVWKQVMTKWSKGYIKTIKPKTLLKGLISFGVVKMLDDTVVKGIDAVKDMIKKSIINTAGNMLKEWSERGKNTSSGLNNMNTKRKASCSTS